MEVYAWLIDFAPFRENCPTGIFPEWMQKVTRRNGTIQQRFFCCCFRQDRVKRGNLSKVNFRVYSSGQSCWCLWFFYSMLHAWFNAWAEMFRFAVSQVQFPLLFGIFHVDTFSLHVFFFHSRIGCFTETGGIARHLPAITARGTLSSTTGSTPTCTVMSAQYVNKQKFRKIPSKGNKVVQQFLRRALYVWELTVSLAHSWDTGAQVQASRAATRHNSLRLSH